MVQIIISKGLDAFFKPIFDELECQVHICVKDDSFDEQLHQESITVVSLQQFTKLSHFEGVIIVAEDFEKLSADNLKRLKELSQDSNCHALVDLSRDVQLYAPLFRTLAQSERFQYRELMNKSLAELQRIKRLHEKLVPLRNQKIKGMQVFSKYIAGESSGGEFFDFIGDEKDYYFFVVSSSSYLATSHTISQFEFLTGRGYIDLDARVNFLEQLLIQVRSFDIPDLEFDLLLAHIDLRKLRIDGHNMGNGTLLSDKKNLSLGMPYSGNLEDNYFNWNFSRGEKLVILSPGVSKNCKGLVDGKKINDYVFERIQQGPTELLNELFFQLKRGASSTFLKYDASAIFIEVDKNVFIEI